MVRAGLLADNRSDLGGEQFNRSVDQVRGQATEIDLAEETLDTEEVILRQDLVDDFLGAACHQDARGAGYLPEIVGVDDPTTVAVRLGAYVFMIVGAEGLAGALRGVCDEEMAGESEYELIGPVAGVFAGLAVLVDERSDPPDVPRDEAEHHG